MGLATFNGQFSGTFQGKFCTWTIFTIFNFYTNLQEKLWESGGFGWDIIC